MSEIDFKEIEKAMAELVNKAQDSKRQQQLGTVVKKRDEIAKKVETARGQGTVATKRIIIGNKSLRAPATHSVRRAPVAASVTPSKNPISDFRPPTNSASTSPNPLAPPPLPSQTFEKEVLGNTQQTVGSLSDEYLQEQVSKTEPQIESPPELEPSEEHLVKPEAVASSAEEKNLLEEVDSEPESMDDLEPQEAPPEVEDVQVMNENVEPEDLADELPESEELGETLDDPSYDYGSIHRVYGQRMNQNFNHYKKGTDYEAQSAKSKQVGKSKDKRSMLNFLVYFLVFASLAVWAGAAYLYFVY